MRLRKLSLRVLTVQPLFSDQCGLQPSLPGVRIVSTREAQILEVAGIGCMTGHRSNADTSEVLDDPVATATNCFTSRHFRRLLTELECALIMKEFASLRNLLTGSEEVQTG